MEFWKKNTLWKECKFCPFCGSPNIHDTRVEVYFGFSKHCENCGIYFIVNQDEANDFGDKERINECRHRS